MSLWAPMHLFALQISTTFPMKSVVLFVMDPRHLFDPFAQVGTRHGRLALVFPRVAAISRFHRIPIVSRGVFAPGVFLLNGAFIMTMTSLYPPQRMIQVFRGLTRATGTLETTVKLQDHRQQWYLFLQILPQNAEVETMPWPSSCQTTARSCRCSLPSVLSPIAHFLRYITRAGLSLFLGTSVLRAMELRGPTGDLGFRAWGERYGPVNCGLVPPL